MNSSSFYSTLTDLEKTYWHKLSEVFAQVQPQQPEKGIEALIQRARKAALEKGTDLAIELEYQFRGASERTRRRLELLGACQLPKQNNDSQTNV